MKAWKFSEGATDNVENFVGSKVFEIRKKLDNGEKLTREEKNWVTEKLHNNLFYKTAIPLMGWAFSFDDVVKKYWVSQYGHITERYAMDKTSIRATTYGRIDRIVEIPN